MGVMESTVHFKNLNGVIENLSGYQIKYKVASPIDHDSVKKHFEKNQVLGTSSNILHEEEHISYAGLVSPYCTKYFEFKDIQNAFQFSISAIKLGKNNMHQIIPLETNLKIQSQKSICIRITPQLKVIHLNDDQINELLSKKNIETKFLKESKVIKNLQLSSRLLQFFIKIPANVQLLYRASENDFDVKKFYETYGQQFSLLLICKTDQNRIIGGYSRNSFIPPQQDDFDVSGWKSVPDESQNSFIFSLTSNDFFRQKQGQPATFYNKNNEQIVFGRDELRINNHSDKNACLSQNFNSCYQNHNYNNDLQSYKLFNGNESPEFRTLEWQVWRLDFQALEDYPEGQNILGLI